MNDSETLFQFDLQPYGGELAFLTPTVAIGRIERVEPSVTLVCCGHDATVADFICAVGERMLRARRVSLRSFDTLGFMGKRTVGLYLNALRLPPIVDSQLQAAPPDFRLQRQCLVRCSGITLTRPAGVFLVMDAIQVLEDAPEPLPRLRCISGAHRFAPAC